MVKEKQEPIDKGLVATGDKVKERPTPAPTDSEPQELIKQKQDTSSEAQRQRLLEWLLTHGSITTLEAREQLDILHPAGRIMELRRQGYVIEMIWTYEPTPCGTFHKVANYVLVLNSKEAA